MAIPWYELANDDRVQQGDCFPACPYVVSPTDVDLSTLDENESLSVEVRAVDAIVLSQSCDLEDRTIKNVLMAPYSPWSDYAVRIGRGREKSDWEAMRRGRFVGAHLLMKCDLVGFARDYVIVDFRETFAITREQLESLGRKRRPRVRLASPYREHLSQEFGRYVMRVGLPVGIPGFETR